MKGVSVILASLLGYAMSIQTTGRVMQHDIHIHGGDTGM